MERSAAGSIMSRFISEDDLKNFEGWLAYQGYDPEMLDSDDLAKWRELFEQISKRLDAKVGLMKLGSKAPDDRIYGVAVQDEGLWLTLWVRRSWKGEFFVFMPRADGSDAHASYHRDGRFHHKSEGRSFAKKKLQRLDQPFVRSTFPHGADMVRKQLEPFVIPTCSTVWSCCHRVFWVREMATSSSTSLRRAMTQ